jgi:hypothetical protein
MIKKTLGKVLTQLGLRILVMVILGVISAPIVQAAPPAQDPRPPVNRGGDEVKGDRGEGTAGLDCAALSGEIINWGYRPEPDILTRLQAGGWEVSTLSGNDGKYNFTGLGVGLARLNVILAPQAGLKPLTADAVVYLNCEHPVVANLGVYSGPAAEPPVSLSMTASSRTIAAGSESTISLTVANELPTDISQVVVTNLMPEGLLAWQSAPAEKSQIIPVGADGQLVVAYLDTVAAGEQVEVVITVSAVEDTPVSEVSNTATLFYRESVAVQASLNLAVQGSGGPVIPAALQETDSTTLVAAEAAAAPADSASETTPATRDEAAKAASEPASSGPEQSSAPIAPAETTQTGQVQSEQSTGFTPPDSALPVTGKAGINEAGAQAGPESGPNFILLIGSGLLLLLGIFAYGLRAVQRQRAF